MPKENFFGMKKMNFFINETNTFKLAEKLYVFNYVFSIIYSENK